MNKKVAACIFLAPSIIGIAVFTAIPFVDAVRRSFFEAMSGKFVGLNNYVSVINNVAFRLAAKNTFKFTFICIPLLMIISLFISLLLKNIKIGKRLFQTTYLLPMAVPVASVVMLWKVFFHKSGILNTFLSDYGFLSIDWINTKSAFYVLVFSYIWKNIGYDIVLYTAGISGISDSLYEAASLDGAGRLQKFWYITLPELLPTIFVIAVLSILNSFKVFREAYLIAGEYPHESIYMLQHLFNHWFLSLDIQKMCAAAVMLAIFVSAVIMTLQKFWSRDD